MSVINNNNQIENGLRADIMRKAMETKALLSAKGSIYVGTGESETVGGEALPKTKALTIGSNGDFLKVVNGDLAYGKIDNSDFSPDVQLDNIWAGRANSADSADSATNAGHATSADSATEATYASSDHTKGTIDDRIDALTSPYTRVATAVKSYIFTYGVSYLVVMNLPSTIGQFNYDYAYIYATTTDGTYLDSNVKFYGTFYFQHTCRNYIINEGQGFVGLSEGPYYQIAAGAELVLDADERRPSTKSGTYTIAPLNIMLQCQGAATMDVYEFKK